jgi:hypothetical protein
MDVGGKWLDLSCSVLGREQRSASSALGASLAATSSTKQS